MGVLSGCVSVHTIMPGTHGGQKRMSGLLGLKLQMIVSCHGTENITWVPGRVASAFYFSQIQLSALMGGFDSMTMVFCIISLRLPCG